MAAASTSSSLTSLSDSSPSVFTKSRAFWAAFLATLTPDTSSSRMYCLAFSAFFWRVSSLAASIYRHKEGQSSNQSQTSLGLGYSPSHWRPFSWRRRMSSASRSFMFVILFRLRKQRGLDIRSMSKPVQACARECVSSYPSFRAEV